MREKPTCTVCFKMFTRKANLLRHMREIHNVLITRLSGVSPFESKHRAKPIFVGTDPAMQKQPPLSGFDKSLSQLSALTKLSVDYRNLMNVPGDIESLNARISSYQNEIANIRLHNRLIPKSEIRGLSGYLCRRCNTISFTDVRHIGYDKTTKAGHMCDEKKVESIKAVSINPLVWWHSYDFLASQMLEALNDVLPDQKYLVAEDMSVLFDYLESLLHPDMVKFLLGIGDRYYYHIISEGLMPNWLTRAVANIGIKTSVDDFEIRDFLRRVSSTYAIFDIPDDITRKRILIKITN